MRQRDFYEKEFEGEFETPKLGYKYCQILEEYGVKIDEYIKPTIDDYAPHLLWRWAIAELKKGLSAGIAGSTCDRSSGAKDSEKWMLPPELDTPEAWEIWKRAQERGLISNSFKWLYGLEMLACFAREFSLRLGLGKGVNSHGGKRISWKPFEKLFNIEKGKLRYNYSDVQREGRSPSDCKIIDEIFGI